jgi:putative ubiquitin-RnfH superfamily antitoxin RatB of RatAB toxin-antitoxin module
MKAMKPLKMKAISKVSVSETNLRKTAIRVLGQKLVSPEVQYLQRTLGVNATQQQLDDQVLAVRRLPWASIVLPD